jgi:AraC-like DNA-binding protein
MSDRFAVQLSEEQQQYLDQLIHHPRCSPRMSIPALIRRQAVTDDGSLPCGEKIARELHVSATTVYRICKRFTELDLEAALFPREGAPRWWLVRSTRRVP